MSLQGSVPQNLPMLYTLLGFGLIFEMPLAFFPH